MCGETLFNGYRVAVWNDEEVLGMDGGDGWLHNSVNVLYLLPLNCTFKNG